MKRSARAIAWCAVAVAVSLVAWFQQSSPAHPIHVAERVRYPLDPSLASRRAADGNGLTITFKKTADWDTGSGVRGYTADITILNGTGSQLHEWDLIFSFLHPVTGMWNASYDRDDIEYTVDPDDWNATLEEGQARSFGFQGTYIEVLQEPTAYVVSGIPVGDQNPPIPVTPGCTLATSFTVTSEWSTGSDTRGFVAEVLLQNAGSSPVNWEIAFDIDAAITNVWNASFLAHDDGYRVTPEPWNARLEPGQTRSFGLQGTFQGAAGSVVGPSDVACNGQEGDDLPAVHLWQEAERTQTQRPVLIVSRFNSDPASTSALCGAYVGVAVEDDGTVIGRSSYTFEVPREGRYFLWARVMTLSGEPRSNLGAVVDGVAVGTWDLATNPDWHWAALGDHQASPGMHLASGERHLELLFQTPGTNVDSLLLTSDPLFDPAPKGNPNCDRSWVDAWNQREIEAYAALTPDERYLADAGRTAFNGDTFVPVSGVRAMGTSNQSRFLEASGGVDATIDDSHEVPDADSDGDGITSAEECINGTEPDSRPCSLTSAAGPLFASAPAVVLAPLPALVPAADERFADLAFGANTALADGTLMVAAAGVTPASGPEVWPLEPAGRSSVYVFEHQADGSWLLVQRLVPPHEWDRDPSVWTSVALEGDTAVVVADSGLAFVYRREGGAWGLTARLEAEAPAEYFSGPVALGGDRIALASRVDRICHRDTSCFPNSVYLFHWSDGAWQREARLDVVGLGERLNPKAFGSSLALAGDRLAASYTSLEIVSIFEPDATGVWREVQRLDSGRTDPLYAPQHVAMDANTLVHLLYQARSDDPTVGPVVARVRIFERGEDGWSLQRELTLPRGGRFVRINAGATVALHGDVIVAGVHRVPDGGSGEVVVLVREPEGWALRQRIGPPGADEPPFGYAVAFDGRHLVVGRPGTYVDEREPAKGYTAGAAYLYETMR